MEGADLQLLLILNRTRLSNAIVLVALAAQACAQNVEKEPAAVLELGAAGNWSVNDSSASFGPNVAVEVTPIKNWLELEAGVTPAFGRHSTEWDTDLLFKSPGIFRRRWSSWRASGRSGFTLARAASPQTPLPARAFSISCSGRRGGTGSAGIWSLVTITASGSAMSGPLASAPVC